MIKLYKRIEGRLHYHEAWTRDDDIIEHWGEAGHRGQQRIHDLSAGKDEDEALESVLSKARENDFAEIDESNLVTLLIEYEIDEMGSSQDLEKRHALEVRMDELLGSTGLGHCDGGSIGCGSMEVACFVVDADNARRVIAEDLQGTEFENYSRIDIE